MSYRGDETTGFQSPAQDYIEPVLDLARLLDLRAPGLYPVRILGHEWRERGIHDGDILVANAAAEPAPGRVCVAFLHGEVILASLRQKDGCWWLAPAKRAPVQVDDSVEVWAIIKALVRMRV
jgi:SOS-response transcriptional repressor LexA